MCLTCWWTTSTKLSFITEEEGVSLWFQSAHLLNSCSVWILFFSSAQVLTAVASSHGQLQPGPQLSRQFHSGVSPARYLPLNYFSSTPSGSLWWVPKEAFPQHWWFSAVPEGQHLRPLPHSLGQNLSTERQRPLPWELYLSPSDGGCYLHLLFLMFHRE